MTAALAALDPLLASTLPRLFFPAPHPQSAGAAGVAIDLAGLGAIAGAGRVSALVPNDLARSVPRRQLSYLGGRLCAEEALRCLGLAGGVGRGDVGEPRWPAGVTGSITHTDRMACAVVARNESGSRGLGIDSEQIDDEGGLQAVMSVCCTQRERATLFAPGVAPRDDRLVATIVFALKEAFYKAIHPRVGRFVEFDELEVHAIDAAAGRAWLRPCLPELAPGASLEGRFTLHGRSVHALVDLELAPETAS
jgi:enterobactin synthetase component D